jgi:hypothetical protein
MRGSFLGLARQDIKTIGYYQSDNEI